ncbi:hypothetical protein HU830_00655 [Lactobacillus sp. DCY120]|uniref:TPR repeat-containing protein n=1 Tax=Bombilactobacillus apium TaxID=2675299 RepID=A0A850R047_9LACO|nr:hypothetical protein [Bombilactobacillus apium]NVY95720.1 hypothetical protein [Bombilactobacillus apium]
MEQTKLKQLITAAKKAEAQRQYSAAVIAWEQAYLLEPSHHLQWKLFRVLHATGQDQKAQELVKDDYAAYFQKKEEGQLLLQVLLANQEFICYRQLLQEHQLRTATNLAAVEFQEQFFRQLEGSLIKQRRQEVLECVTFPLARQVELVGQLKHLPLQEFREFLRILALNPYFHPLLKATLLEEAVKLAETKLIKVSFYGKVRDFYPSQAVTINALPIRQQLQDQLLQQAPELLDEALASIGAEINLFVALVYPFTEEVIGDPHLWIQIILERQGYLKKRQTLEKDLKAVKVGNWLDEFSHLLSLFNL